MLILVDMDGPLSNFELGFVNSWREKYPELATIELTDRRNFKVDNDYPLEQKERVRAIYHAKGFYVNLPIVDGAKEALLGLIQQGHEVRICTAPLTQHKHCVDEKFAWVEHHFGLEFTKRIIIAKDKTVIRGDYLIDDKPRVTGIFAVTLWKQVIFDAPYNREASGLRLNGWAGLTELGCF